MKFNLEKTIRPHLVGMKSYSTSRPVENKNQFILLDANENPFGNFNRYPDAENVRLKQKLAEINKVETGNLFLGNGSDELIDLIMRIFCDPGKDSVMVFNPSFVMYEIYAKMNNVQVEKLQLNSEFQLDKKEFENAISKTQAKILFLCSPNNPTGNSVDDLEYFIQSFNGIVVVDEAYIEFSPLESTVSLLNQYPNLIVLKTLSKAYGMAGLRIGVGISSVEIAAFFNRFKPPYNISSESQRLALEQLEKEDEQAENIQTILAEKEKLKKGLAENKEVVKIYPSHANFFLVEFKDAEKVYQKLQEANIYTSLRHPQLKNCLRLSVGKPEENLKVLNVLSEI
ncbi:histidinol-phosphate transaminase [Chryseobacterium sp. MDT2-18]|uniref:histidinol-phosphate transaminase n=1 Tax=Chryseobacterium sp. MDT2-18 TaxID=1259136 RepID=UPI0027891ED2|nr:histidinol-phosphate transaminase [Chryseobacterium sp. MDT2-18]MDQ0476330.1 histidinol-phosphate aminotransferase [Chryseobacterium sp. MDT2-18]